MRGLYIIMCYWKDFILTGINGSGALLRHPAILLRKTDLKNWAGVYVGNPHHCAHPPAYFCVRARLTTASGHVVAILRGCAHTINGKCLKINMLRLSLCAKVKPFGFTPMHVQVGVQARAWAFVRPLPAPQFSTKIVTHTRTPSRAHLLCLSVCGHDYCAPIMRVW